MAEIQCSILIPAYNAEEHIACCLTSVVEHKTAFAFEVIVVDDGSSDRTSEIVSRDFPMVRLLQKPNGGPGSARNFGAKQAASDILVFIDADDVMMEGRLDHQVGYMLEHPDVKMTFGNQQYERDPDCNYNSEMGWANHDDFEVIECAFSKLMVKGSSVANTATAVWKDVYLETGGQPEDIFVGEDYAMCCAIAKAWPIAACCRYLTWYRQDDHGNLMASAHTYNGPPQVLHENLLESAHLLSAEDLSLAKARLHKLVHMLVRHQWITEGRQKVLHTLKQYSDLLPAGFVRRWSLMSVIPPQIPRAVRVLKHGGRLTHAYK